MRKFHCFSFKEDAAKPFRLLVGAVSRGLVHAFTFD